jgi:hypothetical protein
MQMIPRHWIGVFSPPISQFSDRRSAAESKKFLLSAAEQIILKKPAAWIGL